MSKNITEIEYQTMVKNCIEYYKTTLNVESITKEILTKLNVPKDKQFFLSRYHPDLTSGDCIISEYFN